MLVLVVRHCHAGTKRHWRGHDSLRPLDPHGLAQSEALVPLVSRFTPERIVSSPYVRCVQSVTPLSTVFDIPIERSRCLVPEAGAAAKLLALGVTAAGTGSVVLCTHGEVIRDMQRLLFEEGIASFGSDGPREKGSVWLLHRVDGHFVEATYLAPPRPGER